MQYILKFNLIHFIGDKKYDKIFMILLTEINNIQLLYKTMCFSFPSYPTVA